MYELALSGKIILLRVDFNVPLDGCQQIVDARRIEQTLPTIRYLLKQGAGVLLVSHLGRPTSRADQHLSLKPVFEYLRTRFEQSIQWLPNWPKIPHMMQPGSLAIAENIRYHDGEISNDQSLAKRMSHGIDVYVFDAFACAHRQHASTAGILAYVDEVAIGLLVQKEAHQLDFLLSDESKPMVLIMSGAKVATKLPLLEQLLPKVSVAAVGGVLANTLLQHAGFEVGQSKVEPLDHNTAKQLLSCSHLLLPVDVVVQRGDSIETVDVKSVQPHDCIYDLGPKSVTQISQYLSGVRTIFWNGPLGYFEQQPFGQASINLAKRILESQTHTVIGGGNTMAAIDAVGEDSPNVFCSTGGGASLTYLTGSGCHILESIHEKQDGGFV